jgi:ATPase subunit of ABC transporter with duplicated ATPase domains
MVQWLYLGERQMSEIIVNLTGVNYTYFDRPVLTDLGWEIQASQKIGLVGANGGGKSTLLKLILGRMLPDAGTVFRKRELPRYLPQDVRILS